MMSELVDRALWALDHPLVLPPAQPLPADLYWPPEGAVQFHATMASHTPDTPIEPFVCWVLAAKVAKVATCWRGCTTGWLVLLDSLDPERRAHCMQIRHPGLCECNGNLIE